MARFSRTSRYTTTDATPEQAARARKYFKDAMKSGSCDGPNKETPYAIPYGLIDGKGRKKLFKNCPIFYNAERFDKYVDNHKMTVLAVYNR